MSCRLASAIALLVPLTAGAGGQPLRDLVGISFAAKVVAVIDGDTIDVVRAGRAEKLRIRLEGVDSPETGEPFSQQARTLTRVLTFDQEVSVEGRDVDVYGRLVARVRQGQRDVGVELVRAGLACHYRKYSSEPVLAAAEASAKASGRGFWAGDAQKPVCVAREAAALRGKPVGDGTFVGNVQSRVYHASTCRNAGCKNCTRAFASRAAADEAGFKPAGDCLRALVIQ